MTQDIREPRVLPGIGKPGEAVPASAPGPFRCSASCAQRAVSLWTAVSLWSSSCRFRLLRGSQWLSESQPGGLAVQVCSVRACPRHGTSTAIVWTLTSDPFYSPALCCKRNVSHCTLSSISWWSPAYTEGMGGRYFHCAQLAETFCTNLIFEKYNFY